jgi:putative nucleotidyltransferase with HDIG domain
MAGKGRILFVEDDPQVLDRMRTQAAVMESTWEPEFLGGAQALDACAERPFDAVVADMHLAGLSGPDLLQEIMARYPATIRMLMAADGERDKAMQGLARTHQFLVKPCDFAVLKSMLDFARERGQRVGNDHVRELIARIGQLPVVPELYREISALLDSDRGSVERIGAVIAKDIAMTAAVLKLANSAFFSLRHTVTSAGEAVGFLGIDLIRGLVLMHGLFGQVGAFQVPSFTLQHLWQHCLSVAAAARSIARSEGCGARGNEFFTAGLLHDIGILILASRFPEDYARVLDTNRRSGGELEASEFHIFGATHSEVGAYLLALWGLPDAMVQAAACHHAIATQSSRAFTPALAVHVADTHYGYNPTHEIFALARLDQTYLIELGLANRLPAWSLAMDQSLDQV